MREPPFNSKLRCSQYQPRWLNIHGIEEWLLNIRSHRCMQKRWWLRRVARAWPVRISWQCRNSYGCFCIPKVATNIQPSTARCRGFSATLVDVVSTSALKQRVAYASRTLYFQGLKLSQVLCYVECKTKKKKKNISIIINLIKRILIIWYLRIVRRWNWAITAANLNCDMFLTCKNRSQ